MDDSLQEEEQQVHEGLSEVFRISVCFCFVAIAQMKLSGQTIEEMIPESEESDAISAFLGH
jgi:hypothetical protein